MRVARPRRDEVLHSWLTDFRARTSGEPRRSRQDLFVSWGVSTECRRTRLLRPLRSFGRGRSSLGSLPALCRRARLRAACWTSRTSWRLRPLRWSGSGTHRSWKPQNGAVHRMRRPIPGPILTVARRFNGRTRRPSGCSCNQMPRCAFAMVVEQFLHLAEAIQRRFATRRTAPASMLKCCCTVSMTL